MSLVSPAATVTLSVLVRAGEILRELQTRAKIGVEVGVYRGTLSEILLDNDSTLTLYMVDPWRPMLTESYLATSDKHPRMPQEEHDHALQVTMERTLRFGKRAKIMRMTSLEAAEKFEDATLDFVFIDGDHSYEAVKADIGAWWPKVVRGGIVSGHDYRTDKDYGVIRAVDEFTGKVGLRLGKNHCWFVTR